MRVNESCKTSRMRWCFLVSFDVFDTILVRSVSEPTEVFRHVARAAQRHGLCSIREQAFVEVRVEAETLARVSCKGGECNFDDIYRVLKQLLLLDHGQVAELMKLELETEKRFLEPIRHHLAILEQHREAGSRIAFISDMYLPRMFVEDRLREVGALRNGDHLWISHEHAASKKRGDLFTICRRDTGIPESRWTHFGNDHQGDYDAPRRVGIDGRLLSDGNLTDSESRLSRLTEASDGLASELAGCSRLVRMESEAGKSDKFSVVSGTIFPLMYCFASWVLMVAKQQKLETLFFVSRDGYVPQKIAERIANELGLNIGCKYLFGSRQSWHLAGLNEWDNETANWLLECSDGETFSSVLARLEVDWSEWTTEICPDETWPNPDHEMTADVRERLWKVLSSDTPASRRVLEVAFNTRTTLIRYLEQEKVLSDRRVGIVDLGWTGRSRRSFENSVGVEASKKIHWLYLGLRPNVQPHDEDRVHNFLFGPDIPTKPIPNIYSIAETFCVAPHPSVKGFQTDQTNKIVPVFKSSVQSSLERWGRDDVLHIIEMLTHRIRVSESHLENASPLRSLAHSVAKRFCCCPTVQEALVWGDFPYDQDQAGDAVLALAPPAKFSYKHARMAVIYGSLDRAAGGDVICAWGPASWLRRHYSAYLLLPFVALGVIRVHGFKNAIKIGLRSLKRKLGRSTNCDQ